VKCNKIIFGGSDEIERFFKTPFPPGKENGIFVVVVLPSAETNHRDGGRQRGAT